MDKKVSIYANWKYDTFDRVLARIGNLDVSGSPGSIPGL